MRSWWALYKPQHDTPCPPNLMLCHKWSGDSVGNHQLPRSLPSYRVVAAGRVYNIMLMSAMETYISCLATFSARIRAAYSIGIAGWTSD